MMDSELVVFLIVAALAATPLLRTRAGVGMFAALLLVLATAVTGPILWPASRPAPAGKPTRSTPQPTKAEWYLPREVAGQGFVTSDTCRSCHPGEHASWHASYHRTMTQVASPETVLADFNDVQLELDGRPYLLQRRGDEFWARMPDLFWELTHLNEKGELPSDRQPPIVDRRIVMTTGSHSFQGYWISSPIGLQLLQFPFIYNIRERKWMAGEDAFIRPPEDGRRIAVWNENCIQCHSVNGKPDRQMMSNVAEMGISCEACHGPGEAHIQKYRNPLSRYLDRGLFQKANPNFDGAGSNPAGGVAASSTASEIVNPAKCRPEISTQICGSCHSAFIAKNPDWLNNGNPYRAGDELEKTHHLFRYGDERAREMSERIANASFWADGTMRIGGREYLAHIESPCYKKGQGVRKITCISCHSMHNSQPDDQLAPGMLSNQACLQCHESYRDKLQEHTHHPVDSAGSNCYNCHMPHTSYALQRAIRSHRIDTPNATTSARIGKPNGCNQCHLDKTLDWTSKYLTQWYGQEPAVLTRQQQEISATALWLIQGDAAQRAISAWTLGWDDAKRASGDDWIAPLAAQLLDDRYAPVRFIAYDAIRKLKGFEQIDFDFVGTLQQQQATKQEVLRIWNARPAPQLKNPSPLLFDPKTRRLPESVVSQLRGPNWIDPPMTLPE